MTFLRTWEMTVNLAAFHGRRSRSFKNSLGMRTSLAGPRSFRQTAVHFASRSLHFSTAFFVATQRRKKLLSIPCLPEPNFRCRYVPFFATSVAPSEGLGRSPPPPPSHFDPPAFQSFRREISTTHLVVVSLEIPPDACTTRTLPFFSHLVCPLTPYNIATPHFFFFFFQYTLEQRL